MTEVQYKIDYIINHVSKYVRIKDKRKRPDCHCGRQRQ